VNRSRGEIHHDMLIVFKDGPTYKTRMCSNAHLGGVQHVYHRAFLVLHRLIQPVKVGGKTLWELTERGQRYLDALVIIKSILEEP